MEMMVDPVITTAGLTYERAYIEEWFRTGHTTDPMAHVPVADLLTTNIALKQQIEAFVAHSAVLQQHQQSEEDSKLAMQLRIDELTEQLSRIQMQQRQNDHITSVAQTQVKIAYRSIYDNSTSQNFYTDFVIDNLHEIYNFIILLLSFTVTIACRRPTSTSSAVMTGLFKNDFFLSSPWHYKSTTI